MTQDVAPPGVTAESIWTYVSRTLTGFTGTPRSDLVGSDSAIWAHATRELTKGLAPFTRNFVPSNKLSVGGAGRFLMPLVAAADVTVVDIAGIEGEYTTETETINWLFFSNIAGTGVLKSYQIWVEMYRCFIDTIAGTYYHKLYIQPVVLGFDNVLSNLESERLIAEYSTSEVATAGWYNRTVTNWLQVSGLSLSFTGILGVRLRGTAYTTASFALVGTGLAQLNHWGKWNILLGGELET